MHILKTLEEFARIVLLECGIDVWHPRLEELGRALSRVPEDALFANAQHFQEIVKVAHWKRQPQDSEQLPSWSTQKRDQFLLELFVRFLKGVDEENDEMYESILITCVAALDPPGGDGMPLAFLAQVIFSTACDDDDEEALQELLRGESELPPRLRILNEQLVATAERTGRSDSLFATAICDAMYQSFVSQLGYLFGDPELQHELTEMIRLSADVLSSEEHPTPLQRLSSAAFSAFAIASLCESTNQGNGDDRQIVDQRKALNSIINPSRPELEVATRPLRLLCIKLLHLPSTRAAAHSAEEFVELVRTRKDHFPWLTEMMIAPPSYLRIALGFDPFAWQSDYLQATQALQMLHSSSDDKIAARVAKGCSTEQGRYTFLAAIAQCIFSAESTHAGHTAVETFIAGQKKVLDKLPRSFGRVTTDLCKMSLPRVFDQSPFQPATTSTLMLDSVLLNLFITVAACECGPFGMIASSPRRASSSYFPGAADNGTSVVTSAPSGLQYTRTHCSCGFTFFVSVSAAADASCPSCHRVFESVAGRELEPEPEPQFAAAAATGFHQQMSGNQLVGPRRALSAQAALVADLFSTAAVGFAPVMVARGENLDDLVPGRRYEDLGDYCRRRVLECWMQLKTALGGIDDESTSVFMHGIIADLPSFCQSHSSLDDWSLQRTRDQWEQLFTSDLIEPRAKCVVIACQDFRKRLVANAVTPSNRGLKDLTELELVEIDTPVASSLPRLFRVRARPSMAAVKAHFFALPEKTRTELGFLQLFFQHQEVLEDVRHLSSIIAWSNYVQQQRGHYITQKEAEEKVCAELLSKDGARQIFEAFEGSWNALQSKSFLVPSEGHMQVVTTESKLAQCCLHKGSTLFQVVEKLAARQNSFLQAVLVQAAQGETTGALRYYQRHQPGSKLSDGVNARDLARDVQLLQPHELVAIDMDEFSALSCCDTAPEYGDGLQLRVDWQNLELELALNHLYNAVWIDVDQASEFSFALTDQEQNVYDLLEGIQRRFEECGAPQLPIDNKIRDGIIGSKKLSPPGVRTKLREGFLVFFRSLMQSTVTPDVARQTVSAYMNKWLSADHHLSREAKALFGAPPISTLYLHHLVSLFEELEELVSPFLIEMTHRKYTVALSDSAAAELDRCVDGEAHIPLDSLWMATRRFMVRYLDNPKLQPKDRLCDHLCDRTRWPDDGFRARNDFGRWQDQKAAGRPAFLPSILLEHAYSVHKRLQDKIEARQAAEEERARRVDAISGGRQPGEALAGGAPKRKARPKKRKTTTRQAR